MTDRLRRLAGILLVAVGLIVGPATVLAAPPAGAAGSTVLQGTISDRTSGKPVDGQQVTLLSTKDDQGQPRRTVTTGADGVYRFTGLDGGSKWKYAVSVEFKGVVYQMGPMELKAGQTKTQDVPVFDTTQSAGKVSITRWLVWVDTRKGTATVQHDLTFDNSGDRSYIGKEPVKVDEDRPGQQTVVPLVIPSGATAFQYLGRFMDCCSAIQKNRFVHTAPIQPGESGGTVQFSVKKLTQLRLVAPFATDSLTVLVPTRAHLTSKALSKGRTTNDQGVTYQAYGATGLKAGQTIDVAVSGIGASGVDPRLYVLAGLVVLAAGGTFGIRVRARGKRSGAGGHAGGRQREERAPAAATPSVAESVVADDEARLLLDELAALDLAHERGLMVDDVYQRLRAARFARLIEVRGQTATVAAGSTGEVVDG